MSSPYFNVESDTMGTLRVSGGISFANAARALGAMPHAGPRGSTLDLDLAALEHVDSATLAVLIAWSARARRQGVTLHYRRAPRGLLNLAKLCDVDRLLGLA